MKNIIQNSFIANKYCVIVLMDVFNTLYVLCDLTSVCLSILEILLFERNCGRTANDLVIDISHY